MTTSQIVLVGVILVLFLNAAVYALRALFLLLQNRPAPVLSVLFGFWSRVLSGDLDGLNQQGAELFLSLRRSLFISMALLLVTGVVGLAYLSQ